MKILIIGAGVSSFTTAMVLQEHRHDITIVEKCKKVGGHATTVSNAHGNHFDPAFGIITPAWINTLALWDKLGVHTELPINNFNEPAIYGQNVHADQAEIYLFMKLIPTVLQNKAYNYVSCLDFLTANNFSQEFVIHWFIGNAVLFFAGHPLEYYLEMPIRLVMKVYYYSSINAHYYLPKHGSLYYMNHFKQYLEQKGVSIYTNSTVDTASTPSNITIQTPNETLSQTFDHVIFAIQPHLITQYKSLITTDQYNILKQFNHTTTTVCVLNDSASLPTESASQHDDLFDNQDEIHYGTRIVADDENLQSSLNFLKAMTCTHDNKTTVIASYDYQTKHYTNTTDCTFSHTVVNVDTQRLRKQLKTLQGPHVWFCGSWTRGLTLHEDAVVSGIKIANKICQANYPLLRNQLTSLQPINNNMSGTNNVQTTIINILANILQLDSSDNIDKNESFSNMGISSVQTADMAYQLSNHIQNVEMSDLYEHDTVEKLTAKLTNTNTAIAILTKEPQPEKEDYSELMIEPNMVQSNMVSNMSSIDIAVRVYGTGDKAMVLLHGFPECWYSWRKVIPRVVNLGFKVYVPDLRGYGDTIGPDDYTQYHIDNYCSDLDAVVTHFGLTNITIIGHDVGSVVAWHYARTCDVDQVTQLVMIGSPTPFYGTGSLMENDNLSYMKDFASLSNADVNNVRQIANIGHFLKSIEFVDHDGYYETFLSKQNLTKPLYFYRCIVEKNANNTYQDDYKLACPALIMYGKDDFLMKNINYPASVPIDRMEQYHVECIAGGHDIHQECTDEFWHKLKNFIYKPKAAILIAYMDDPHNDSNVNKIIDFHFNKSLDQHPIDQPIVVPSYQPSLLSINLEETIVHQFYKHVQTHPDKEAFIWHNSLQKTIWTNNDLWKRTTAVVSLLQRKTRPREPVLLCYEPGLDFIASFMGCLASNRIAVPVYPPDPNNPKRGIDKIASAVRGIGDNLDYPLSLVLTSPTISKSIMWLKIRYRSSMAPINKLQWMIVKDAPVMITIATAAPNDLAFIQFTSGSTNLPKGVMISHRALMNNLMSLMNNLYTGIEPIAVSWVPQYHDMGLVATILLSIFNNSLCVLMSPMDFIKNPSMWLELITQYRATHVSAPNFAHELCCNKIHNLENINLSSIVSCASGGEPINHTTMTSFTKKFSQCGLNPDSFNPVYGLAELCLYATGRGPTLRPTNVAQYNNTTIVSCGLPGTNTEFKIVNDGKEAANGEIWLTSTSMALGYIGLDDINQATFHATLDHDDRHWYRTGDAGFIKNNELYICGRISDTIILNGVNYYPDDIEYSVGRADKLLKPGSTVAIQSSGLTIVAETRQKSIDSNTSFAIIANIKNSVWEDHALTCNVVLVKPKQVLKTTSGKLKRKAMREMLERGELKIIDHVDGYRDDALHHTTALQHTTDSQHADVLPQDSISQQENPVIILLHSSQHKTANKSFKVFESDYTIYDFNNYTIDQFRNDSTFEQFNITHQYLLNQSGLNIQGETIFIGDKASIQNDTYDRCRIIRDIYNLHELPTIPYETKMVNPIIITDISFELPGCASFSELASLMSSSTTQIKSKCVDDSIQHWGAFLELSNNGTKLTLQQQAIMRHITNLVQGRKIDKLKLYLHYNQHDDIVSPGSFAKILFNILGIAQVDYEFVHTDCSSFIMMMHKARLELNCGIHTTHAIVAGAHIADDKTYRDLIATGNYANNGKVNPFDKNAQGYVPGDAAGAILMERMCTGTYLAKMTSHHECSRIMKKFDAIDVNAQIAVLKKLNVGALEVHGISTIMSDALESEAILKAFDVCPAIVTGKPIFGHAFGCSGLMEVVRLLMMLKTNVIPGNGPIDRSPYVDEGFNFIQHDQPLGQQNVGLISYGSSGDNVALQLAPNTNIPSKDYQDDLMELTKDYHDFFKAHTPSSKPSSGCPFSRFLDAKVYTGHSDVVTRLENFHENIIDGTFTRNNYLGDFWLNNDAMIKPCLALGVDKDTHAIIRPWIVKTVDELNNMDDHAIQQDVVEFFHHHEIKCNDELNHYDDTTRCFVIWFLFKTLVNPQFNFTDAKAFVQFQEDVTNISILNNVSAEKCLTVKKQNQYYFDMIMMSDRIKSTELPNLYAWALLDTFVYAGGRGVPTLLTSCLEHIDKCGTDVDLFILETVRLHPPVTHVPYDSLDGREMISLYGAFRDPSVWGADADDFKIKDADEYNDLFAWGEITNHRSCPGKSISMKLIRCFLQQYILQKM